MATLPHNRCRSQRLPLRISPAERQTIPRLPPLRRKRTAPHTGRRWRCRHSACHHAVYCNCPASNSISKNFRQTTSSIHAPNRSGCSGYCPDSQLRRLYNASAALHHHPGSHHRHRIPGYLCKIRQTCCRHHPANHHSPHPALPPNLQLRLKRLHRKRKKQPACQPFNMVTNQPPNPASPGRQSQRHPNPAKLQVCRKLPQPGHPIRPHKL